MIEIVYCRRCNHVISESNLSDKTGILFDSIPLCKLCMSEVCEIHSSFNTISKFLDIKGILKINPDSVVLDGSYSSNDLNKIAKFMDYWDEFE